MTTLTEKIAVMQAAERGKKIRCCKRGCDNWYNTGTSAWNWEYYDYEVALSDWWDVVSFDGTVVFSRHGNVVAANASAIQKITGTYKIVHVREVIDE